MSLLIKLQIVEKRKRIGFHVELCVCEHNGSRGHICVQSHYGSAGDRVARKCVGFQRRIAKEKKNVSET